MTGRNGTTSTGAPITLRIDVPPEQMEVIARRAAELVGTPTREPWIGVDQAARHLGYSDATMKQGHKRVYDLHQRRCVRFQKDGSRLLTKRSWLDEYVDGQAG
jgi:hypothetical protein